MTSQLIFCPPTLNLKKNPVNQLIIKFWPKRISHITIYYLHSRLYVIGRHITDDWSQTVHML